MNLSQLSVLSYANYFTQWHYKMGKRQQHHKAKEKCFFKDAQHLLRAGDMIICQQDIGLGFPLRQLVVVTSYKDVVEVKPMMVG